MVSEQDKQLAFETVKTTSYLKLLGIELIEIEVGQAVMSLQMHEKLRQPYGLLHGGATASLIDTAMAFAVKSATAKDETATTVDLTVQLSAPAHKRQNRLHSESFAGGKTAFIRLGGSR